MRKPTLTSQGARTSSIGGTSPALATCSLFAQGRSGARRSPSPSLAEGAIVEDLRAWQLRCLIFVGAGDADFLDQAREAVDDIP
jgi:hypothetical protein